MRGGCPSHGFGSSIAHEMSHDILDRQLEVVLHLLEGSVDSHRVFRGADSLGDVEVLAQEVLRDAPASSRTRQRREERHRDGMK